MSEVESALCLSHEFDVGESGESCIFVCGIEVSRMIIVEDLHERSYSLKRPIVDVGINLRKD